MTKAPELKPCPFCGGEAKAYPQTCRQSDPYQPNDRGFPIVRCGKCYAEVGGENFPRCFGDVSSAITNWNTRADLALAAEAAARIATLKEAAAWVAGLSREAEELVLSLTDVQPPDQQSALDAYVADRIAALEAQLAEAKEALRPFAFTDDATTQEAWETRYRDRFKDWIDFDDIDRARATLAKLEGKADG